MTEATKTSSAVVTPNQPRWRLLCWLTAEPVSLIGDQIFFLAIAWTAVQEAGPAGAGLVLAAGAVPRALFMLLGGTLVDRLGPRRVALSSDILRALLMLAAAVIAAAGATIPLLLALALIFGVIDALFYPATNALAPLVVAHDQLVRVQNLRALGTRAAVLIGAPLGGLLLAIGGPSTSFAVNAATFAVSAVALTALRIRSVVAQHQDGAGGVVRQAMQGLRYALGKPVIRNLLLMVALLEFAVNGVINTAFPALAAERQWGAQGLGWLMAALGAGAAAAALVLVIIRRLPAPGLVVAGAACTGAIVMSLFPAAVDLPATLTLSVALGAVGGAVAGIVLPIIQADTPPDILGRTMSLFALATVGVSPLSIAAAALITDQAGLRTAFLAAAALALVGAAACITSGPVRNIALKATARAT
ncbi:MFS transporter [Micromonospora peucetia]|uniref:Predicted arabinose efflux permease, MFS family n=1 Tax=Micromonospora peucetia TaxID=47871 RepID=A0A1C6TV49_9ACTN|nr:MFS transporter [Micromonospora peucetia]SCL45690.1 Predicted arabinose efflux permease, MFS family [Micromonospora peucetia]